MTGFGIMPQSSTEFIPFRAAPRMIETADPFISNQTASSRVQLDIMEIYRIGEDNYLRIQEISRFKKGWDGNKARPIPESVINRTKSLLMSLPSGAQVFPTSRSTMQIEYHKNKGNYFEIEVFPKTYELYYVKGDNEFEGNVNKREIKKRFDSFLV